MEPCPAGKFTEDEGAIGLEECKACPAGSWCAQGTPNPVQCEPGFFSNTPGNMAKTDCAPCTSGWACTQYGLTEPDHRCSPGYYCPSGNSRPNQTEYACPAGTYTNFKNLTAVEQCSKCPKSFSCPIGTGGVQKPPRACAAGHYCPEGTQAANQFPCSAGSYTNKTNLDNQNQCEICPRGWFCLQGSTTPTGICFVGHWCPQGTPLGNANPCHAGSYSNKTGNERWEQCEDCPPGHYCPKGSALPTPCPTGSFNELPNGQNLTACTPCTAGYYCPGEANVNPIECGKGNYTDKGASSCLKCREGRYCNQDATSWNTMWNSLICPPGLYCPEGLGRAPDLPSNKCPKGRYCPGGDINPCPVPCPNGTFSDEEGLKQVSQCESCTPGYYCETEGLIKPTGECPGGYYCPKGTAEPFSNPCPAGFYRNGSAKESSQDCAECISGFYCDVPGLALPKECPAGFFCVSGSTIPQPCPLGTYSNSTGLRRSTDCTPCPGGYYCDGIGMTKPTDVCDAGFYCRQKQYTSAPPDTPNGGVCPKGGYCPAGSAIPSPCDPGKYSASEGAKTKFDCVPCDPGYFCAGSSSADATRPCAAGYYCTGGADKPTQHETQPGHYSKEGAFKQEPCPRGRYQPAARSSECLLCLQGYYCNTTGTIDPVICPKGYYCPQGSEVPTPCPRGSYLNDVGKYDISHCDSCIEGQACESVGLDLPNTKCAPGYYCNSGSNDSHPIDQSFGDLCKPGFYCPEGTPDYNLYPCANGTYSNVTGNQDSENCTLCDPGRVCAGGGLIEPNGYCDPGYFCRGGAKTARPRDGGATGDLCPVGHYCPRGTGEPIRCPPGMFQNMTGYDYCMDCPPGFYCTDGEIPLKCSKGRYCPGNTTLAQPLCPRGTFNPQLGMVEVSDCKPCLGGFYCEALGAINFDFSLNDTGTGKCEAGYYCKEGKIKYLRFLLNSKYENTNLESFYR